MKLDGGVSLEAHAYTNSQAELMVARNQAGLLLISDSEKFQAARTYGSLNS